jgi:hypothetical protein
MAVIFAADLAISTDVEVQFTPSNDVSREYDIYEIYFGKHPTSSWWYDWGGHNDIPVSNKIQVYIGGQNVIPVDSLEDCCKIEFSIYDEPTAGMVYKYLTQTSATVFGGGLLACVGQKILRITRLSAFRASMPRVLCPVWDCVPGRSGNAISSTVDTMRGFHIYRLMAVYVKKGAGIWW